MDLLIRHLLYTGQHSGGYCAAQRLTGIPVAGIVNACPDARIASLVSRGLDLPPLHAGNNSLMTIAEAMDAQEWAGRITGMIGGGEERHDLFIQLRRANQPVGVFAVEAGHDGVVIGDGRAVYSTCRVGMSSILSSSNRCVLI